MTPPILIKIVSEWVLYDTGSNWLLVYILDDSYATTISYEEVEKSLKKGWWTKLDWFEEPLTMSSNQPQHCSHTAWDAKTDTCVDCGLDYYTFTMNVAEEAGITSYTKEKGEPKSVAATSECKCEMLFAYGHKNDCPEKKS